MRKTLITLPSEIPQMSGLYSTCLSVIDFRLTDRMGDDYLLVNITHTVHVQ